MSELIRRFWSWYERYAFLNLAIATVLFSWQLIHLLWLTIDVVFVQLLGTEPILTSSNAQIVLALVDYTEIPALITTSLVYLNQLRKHKRTGTAIRNLIFLNSQWLHIFWITDTFVLEHLTGAHQTILAGWLAALAIAIDYLELPVMIETIGRFLVGLKKYRQKQATPAAKAYRA